MLSFNFISNKIKLILLLFAMIITLFLNNSLSIEKFDIETARTNLKYVSAAMYSENAKGYYLSGGCVDYPFHMEKVDSKEVLDELQWKIPNNFIENLYISESGALSDKNTGIRFFLLKDLDAKEFIISFGSTFSGKESEEAAQFVFDFMHRIETSVEQILWEWQEQKKIPKIYLQAAEITAILKSVYGEKIVTAGTSLGGALAIYAAAKNNIKGKGFGTAPFNVFIVSEMEKSDKVENFVTKGDIVSDIFDIEAKRSKIENAITWLKGGKHIGKVYLMEPLSEDLNLFDKHSGSWYAIAKKAYPEILEEEMSIKEMKLTLKGAVLPYFKKY